MPNEGLWVTSTKFLREEVLFRSNTDVAMDFFNRVAQPGDAMEVEEDLLGTGMLLIVRHRLPE